MLREKHVHDVVFYSILDAAGKAKTRAACSWESEPLEVLLEVDDRFGTQKMQNKFKSVSNGVIKKKLKTHHLKGYSFGGLLEVCCTQPPSGHTLVIVLSPGELSDLWSVNTVIALCVDDRAISLGIQNSG